MRRGLLWAMWWGQTRPMYSWFWAFLQLSPRWTPQAATSAKSMALWCLQRCFLLPWPLPVNLAYALALRHKKQILWDIEEDWRQELKNQVKKCYFAA